MAIDASLAHLHKHDDRAAARKLLLPVAIVAPTDTDEHELSGMEPQTLEGLIACLPDTERVAYVLHDVERASDESVAAHLERH